MSRMVVRQLLIAACGWASLSAEDDVAWLATVQQPPAQAPAVVLPDLLPANQSWTQENWETRRKQLREQWLTVLGPMPARPQTSTYEVLRTDTLPTVTRLLIEYECEPGLKVQGYLLRPRGNPAPRSLPGVVALHPTTDRTIEIIAGLEGSVEKQTGLQLAERGFVVMCPRCFLWQDAASLPAAVSQHRMRHPQTLGMHKMLFDAQRAVDLLENVPEVDPQRLGAYGHSLGAKETLYLAAFDDRIKAAVASEGGVAFDSTNWDASWYLGPIIHEPTFPHRHHELMALMAPRAFLVMGGETGPGAADGDRSWPYIAAALPAYQMYGSRARLGLLNHHEGHRLSPESFDKLADWLTVYLRK
ncbi:hypothetical protein GC163_14835 [bacterium]|nr:hypothetical protein [bacterium]